MAIAVIEHCSLVHVMAIAVIEHCALVQGKGHGNRCHSVDFSGAPGVALFTLS